jgi:hypothetical protein
MKRLSFLIVLVLSSVCWGTPVYCKPDVIKAMKFIWSESHNGTTGIEAAFMLNGTPEAYTIEQEPMTGEKGMQTVIEYPDQTFAIVHVHPNNSGQYPSTPSNNYMNNGKGDTGLADQWHIDIYVIHRLGLSVYRWQTKETVLLRRGMDWINEKGCE